MDDRQRLKSFTTKIFSKVIQLTNLLNIKNNGNL